MYKKPERRSLREAAEARAGVAAVKTGFRGRQPHMRAWFAGDMPAGMSRQRSTPIGEHGSAPLVRDGSTRNKQPITLADFGGKLTNRQIGAFGNASLVRDPGPDHPWFPSRGSQ